MAMHYNHSVMPSFFKHPKGIQKPHFIPHKHICYVTPMHLHPHFNVNVHDLNYFMPPLPPLVHLVPLVPAPTSSAFDSNDCIWYYGTVYVKEAVAVAKLNLNEHPGPPVTPVMPVMPVMPVTYDDNDDDAESVSSCKHTLSSIAKQNQIKYLKHGMRLRHSVPLNSDNWFAKFDADTNRIIRTPDGVAFDTLRQFARLHCNEVLSMDTSAINVWTDLHFQYEDDDGKWHPLASLKKK